MFYEIDPENRFGGLKFKHNVFRFHMPYGYVLEGDSIGPGQPQKLYTTLTASSGKPVSITGHFSVSTVISMWIAETGSSKFISPRLHRRNICSRL